VLEKSSRVKEKGHVGSDYDTYVYSATMDVDILEWWVNWAEFRKNGEVFFHMGLLDGERSRAKDALRTVRRDVRNILAWGLCNRLPVLKKRFGVTFEADRQVIMAKT